MWTCGACWALSLKCAPLGPVVTLSTQMWTFGACVGGGGGADALPVPPYWTQFEYTNVDLWGLCWGGGVRTHSVYPLVGLSLSTKMWTFGACGGKHPVHSHLATGLYWIIIYLFDSFTDIK